MKPDPAKEAIVSDALNEAVDVLRTKVSEMRGRAPLGVDDTRLLCEVTTCLTNIERNRAQLVMAAMNQNGRGRLPGPLVQRLIATFTGVRVPEETPAPAPGAH